MPKKELFKVWYRSLLDDGTIWCESSTAAEVVLMSKGHATKFERMEVFMVTGDWKPWATKPDENA